MKQHKLVCNVANTKYAIVRSIAKKEIKFKVTEDDIDDFDLLWSDHVIPNERIMRMKSF